MPKILLSGCLFTVLAFSYHLQGKFHVLSLGYFFKNEELPVHKVLLITSERSQRELRDKRSQNKTGHAVIENLLINTEKLIIF